MQDHDPEYDQLHASRLNIDAPAKSSIEGFYWTEDGDVAIQFAATDNCEREVCRIGKAEDEAEANAVASNWLAGRQRTLDFFGAENQTAVVHRAYKSTVCGAWIEFTSTGIRMGSIVEGCDFGTAIYPLDYADNFTFADIQDRIDAIEAEAEAIWEWCNRPCDKNGKWRKNGSTTLAELGCDAPDVDFEYRHLNPDGRSS